MTKIIKDSYEDYIKKADKGFRMLYERMPLGKAILYANGGSGYQKFFESFKNDVKSKMKSGTVAFGSSQKTSIRQPNIKRRSLMKRKQG
jgi:hypothetical protein